MCKTVQASVWRGYFSQGGDLQHRCLPESVSTVMKQSFRTSMGTLAQGMALFLYCQKCNTCLKILTKGIMYVLICLPFKVSQEVNCDWYFVMYWLVASVDFYICPWGNSYLHIFRSWDSVQLEMIIFFLILVFFPSRLQYFNNKAIFYCVNAYFKNNKHFTKLTCL